MDAGNEIRVPLTPIIDTSPKKAKKAVNFLPNTNGGNYESRKETKKQREAFFS